MQTWQFQYFLFNKYINLKTGRFETRRFETWRFVNLTFCKPDVLKPDVLKPDVLKTEVLWVYRWRPPSPSWGLVRDRQEQGTSLDQCRQPAEDYKVRTGEKRDGGGLMPVPSSTPNPPAHTPTHMADHIRRVGGRDKIISCRLTRKVAGGGGTWHSSPYLPSRNPPTSDRAG